MFTLFGATEIVFGALPSAISFISTCGGWPTRFAASRLLPAICHKVEGPVSYAAFAPRSDCRATATSTKYLYNSNFRTEFFYPCRHFAAWVLFCLAVVDCILSLVEIPLDFAIAAKSLCEMRNRTNN